MPTPAKSVAIPVSFVATAGTFAETFATDVGMFATIDATGAMRGETEVAQVLNLRYSCAQASSLRDKFSVTESLSWRG